MDTLTTNSPPISPPISPSTSASSIPLCEKSKKKNRLSSPNQTLSVFGIFSFSAPTVFSSSVTSSSSSSSSPSSSSSSSTSTIPAASSSSTPILPSSSSSSPSPPSTPSSSSWTPAALLSTSLQSSSTSTSSTLSSPSSPSPPPTSTNKQRSIQHNKEDKTEKKPVLKPMLTTNPPVSRSVSMGFHDHNNPSRIMNPPQRDEQQDCVNAAISRELDALQRVQGHCNLVCLKEFIEKDSEVFYVFPIYQTQPLLPHLSCKEGSLVEPLPVLQCQNYFKQLVSAISHVHACGVIHRDIKPENIMLGPDNILKLGDFGSAQIFEGEDDWLTNSDGTAPFLAPEMCSISYGKVGGRKADIWALGVTLYCFIFGTLPFADPLIFRLYHKIIHHSLTFPFSNCKEVVPESCIELLTKLLTKEPKERISMREIGENLWLKS
eukprot:Lithocolla_globosa_v1_NODE_1581_length_2469_cov_52.963546.p1 type:complete len:434 gc:universal NODE_1581_length_2469_cov_52.963546:1069-2370(+)